MTHRQAPTRILTAHLLAASLGIFMLGAVAAPPALADAGDESDAFSFFVAGDIQGYAGAGDHDTCAEFRGIAEAIGQLGGGSFLISPGDLAPVADTYWTITTTLGSDYIWYPVMGNHETPSEEEDTPGENLAWLQAYDLDPNGPDVAPDLVQRGPSGCPATTYSFDYGQVHFVALNLYCDATGPAATDGDVSDHLYAWLEEDLAASKLPVTFVFGHEPAYPMPDTETNRVRHAANSLNAFPGHRDRFWQLLSERGVTAYFAGHIHAYSAPRIDGVWQITSAHARGIEDAVGRSSFMRVIVDGTEVWYETYRQLRDDACAYELTDVWDSATSKRDIEAPTPAPSPTPPPRGLVGRLTKGSKPRGVALGVAALALAAGAITLVLAAVRSARR